MLSQTNAPGPHGAENETPSKTRRDKPIMSKKRNTPYNPALAHRVRPGQGQAAVDLNRGIADHIAVEVDDPHGEEGDKVTVIRSLRSDPLAQLLARKHIDEAQYQGGRAYQADFERSGTGIRAFDYERVIVDGGQAPADISDGQLKAVDRLVAADRALGLQGLALVQDVLVNGFSMEQVASIRGQAGQRAAEYFGKRFRECLDDLAKVYGFATGARRVLSRT